MYRLDVGHAVPLNQVLSAISSQITNAMQCNSTQPNTHRAISCNTRHNAILPACCLLLSWNILLFQKKKKS